MTVTTIATVVAGACFFGSALIAVYRIVRGPSILDRMIASDVLLATLMCALAAEMVYHGHARSLPLLLVLALFAMVGSISVARYVSKHDHAQPGAARGSDAGSALDTDAEGSSE